MSVARSYQEQKEADSAEISRGKSLKYRISSKRLAKMVDATERVAAHSHRNALQVKRFSFFEEVL
jgi:hypothetical protein